MNEFIMEGRRSGTEFRHKQPYVAPLGDSRNGVCECVSLKCIGTMCEFGGGKQIKCYECGLTIKNPRWNPRR